MRIGQSRAKITNTYAHTMSPLQMATLALALTLAWVSRLCLVSSAFSTAFIDHEHEHADHRE